jgi:hypothetical protein
MPKLTVGALGALTVVPAVHEFYKAVECMVETMIQKNPNKVPPSCIAF